MNMQRRSPFWGTIGFLLVMIILTVTICTHRYIETQNCSESSSIVIVETTELIDDTSINTSQTTEEPTTTVFTQTSSELTQKEIPINNKSDFKSYMPYTAITNKSSKQYELQQQAYTDENGIRCIDGRPLIAVGTGWGLYIGDIVLVICNNGNSFEAIIGDWKANIHTKSDNKTTIDNNCRCEFIVDMSVLIPSVRRSGNVSVLEPYNGYVTNVQKID